MRRLLSRCKKSLPSSSSHSYRAAPSAVLTLITLWGFVALSAFFPASCRTREEVPTAPAMSAPPPATALAPEVVRPPKPDALVFAAKDDSGASVEVARVDYDRCLKGPAQGHDIWTLRFASPFGVHSVAIDFRKPGETAQATIDGQSYQIALREPWNAQELSAACDSVKTGDAQLEIAKEMVEPLRGRLTTIAPDCNFSLTAGRWSCAMGMPSLVQMSAKVHDIRNSMMIRWSRHPYLLTRRTALTLDIVDALTGPEAEVQSKNLDSLCRVMGMQIPAELPLVFRSTTVQKAVCGRATGPGGPGRAIAAQAALNDALTEIEALRNRLEATSHLGTLTIRIPHTEAHGKELWVSLSPLPEEAGTQSLSAPHNPEQVLGACWNPIYSGETGLVKVALDLGLISRAGAGACQYTGPVAKASSVFDNYVTNSITSESEFTVSNGVPKLLRLPAGNYHYAIRVPTDMMEDPVQENDAPKATGVISWKNRRPSATVIQW